MIASALADIIARGSVFDGSKDDGYDIDDSLDRDTIAEYLFNTFTGIIKETSAGDDTLVHIADAETITGAKTFTQKLVAQNGVQIDQDPAGDNDAARKAYIDNNFTLLPINATTADANKFTTPQRLACPSSVANLPEAKVGFMDIYKAKDDNDIIQVYYLNDNSAIYARTSTNGGSTWSEWKLQTVSDLTAYVKSVNSVTPDPKTGNVNIEIPDFVPSGTKMLFYEAAAPTGWTIDNTLNDVGVKIVNANGGTIGGATAFSSIFGKAVNTSSTTVTISGNTGSRQLTVAMLPSHTHPLNGSGEFGYASGGAGYSLSGSGKTTGSTGSNGTHDHTFSGSSSHNHNITLNLRYINVIVCIKN